MTINFSTTTNISTINISYDQWVRKSQFDLYIYIYNLKNRKMKLKKEKSHHQNSQETKIHNLENEIQSRFSNYTQTNSFSQVS